MNNTVKPKLLLLHGAIGSQEQFAGLVKFLQKDFETIAFNFSGHGGKALPPSEFSILLFANDVLAFLKEKNISSIHIFGYSMGGYVALYLARHFPNVVNKIFTLATKFDWNMESAERETKMLIPEKTEEKVPAFASQLKQLHSPQDWKIVMRKTANMILAMVKHPPLVDKDFSEIKNIITMAVGDNDKMVSADETMRVAIHIPNATFLLLNNTQHPIEQVDLKKLSDLLALFFLN